MRAAILAMMAVTLAACGSTTPAPPPPISNAALRAPADAAVDALAETAAAMAKMSQFADDMCKCSDRACADLVTQQFFTWGKEMAKAGEQPKMSEHDTKEMVEVSKRFAECMTAVYAKSAGSGSTP